MKNPFRNLFRRRRRLSLQERWMVDADMNEQVARIVHSQCFGCEFRVPYRAGACPMYRGGKKPLSIREAKTKDCPFYQKESMKKPDEDALSVNWWADRGRGGSI